MTADEVQAELDRLSSLPQTAADLRYAESVVEAPAAPRLDRRALQSINRQRAARRTR